MRAFLAVELSPPIRKKLVEQIERLRASGADVKWASDDALHVTLKFLGEVEERKIVELNQWLPTDQARFQIHIRHLGTFPERGGDIRVVWAGIEGAALRLAELADLCSKAATKIGVPEETRPFQAHVTLGRVKSPRNLAKLRHLIERDQGAVFGTQDVEEIVLFQSELRSEGALYTPMARIKLA